MSSDRPCRECGEPLAEDATASADSDVCDDCSSASQVTDSQDSQGQGRKKRWAAFAVGIAGAAAAYVGVRLARGSGADHTWAEDDEGDSDDWDDDWDDDESLSVWDAADIWRSSGEDEDYTFGYSSEELRQAADEW